MILKKNILDEEIVSSEVKLKREKELEKILGNKEVGRLN